MSDRNFSRRRRGGMRFRPSGGLNQKPDRSAQQARAEATGEKKTENIFERGRHDDEIERAENIAAGLPPQAPQPAEPDRPAEDEGRNKRGAFRKPRLETPAEVQEEKYEPVPIQAQPQGLVNSIRHAADKVIRKVQRFIKPEEKTHKEIIINAESLETRIAVQENGRLEEFTIERTTEERLVGSIFKGKVRNLEDGLKAAFVDIGFEKNAFLHYWDIVPSFDSGVEVVERAEPKRRDRPRVTQKDIPRLYPPGSEIIVQVTKGPIGTKGPRVTTNLTLPGRYLILLPNSDQSGISRKIENPEERQRLKKILREINIPEGMGVIMRTAGEGQQKRYFILDLALLMDQWTEIQQKIKTQSPATCVFQEPDLIERTVRDFLTEDVARVVVDTTSAYDRMRAMISRVSTRAANKVKLYNEHRPIFDHFNISRQLENAFSRQVHLKSGGYIVMDETEALVAIDVNTGRHKGSRDQESTILRVNQEAADEICRQLRLRNMGGLIVLDFIDMKSRRDQQLVYQRIKDGLRRDKARTHVLPISQLGLMEMTRQRHSESVRSAVYDDCPYCKGRGKVKSAITMSVEIQRKLNEILKKRSRDDSDFQLRIAVHPTVLERLRTEDEKLIIEMEKRYFGKLSFRPEPTFHAEQFKIVNAATNEELANVGS
ncbi:MAG TPA: Rne/Rng family ribonuclease [Candidatus Baltobacteraceae bacterium]|jgi:ribonuclease G|nr:Rne/Rng family ribonuclease [Candidatus Baltobacteraceae bacterium]